MQSLDERPGGVVVGRRGRCHDPGMRGTLRTPFVVALVVLVAGGAATSSVGASGDAIARCRSKQLLVTSVSAGAGLGHTYLSLIFINRGSRCSLAGYPGVSPVRYGDHGPVQIGPAAHRGNQMESGRSRSVVLERNGTASSVLDEVAAVNYDRSRCTPTIAQALRVYPPNERVPLFLGATVTVCKRIATLGVTPVELGVPHALPSVP